VEDATRVPASHGWIDPKDGFDSLSEGKAETDYFTVFWIKDGLKGAKNTAYSTA